ncbi:MAG: hypothetical protein IPO92_01405 [Saprospiraceae bacterium]|nr:hypothetical protein [Saprospiraceae bacterium]
MEHLETRLIFEYFFGINIIALILSEFSIKRLVTNYFEGSVNELVSFLVKENDITLSEFEIIKQVINKNISSATH